LDRWGLVKELPMSDRVTTDVALSQFLGAVQAGAGTWTLDEACQQALRMELRDSFDTEVTAGHWPAAEQKMMRVGQYVGALSAMLSESQKPAEGPQDLDLDALLRAAGIVQALVCPFDGRHEAAKGVATGRYCRPGQFGVGLDVTHIKKILTGR
jgi:hypothetical protein